MVSAVISVRQSPQDILTFGAIAPVKIAPVGSANFVDGIALIDTGADGCALTQSLFDAMGGVLSGARVRLQEANRPAMDVGATRALVRFHTGTEVELDFGVIADLPPPHNVLLGRNLFEGGGLVIDFANGRFEMHLEV